MVGKRVRIVVCVLLICCSNGLFGQGVIAATQIDSLELPRYWVRPIYLINKDYVVYEYGSVRKIIYADMPSFKILDEGIAKDKNGAYFKDTLLKVKSDNLVLIKRIYDGRGQDVLYWKTKNRVFRNSKELADIDATTFEILSQGEDYYYKDKNGIYYLDKKIQGADPIASKPFILPNSLMYYKGHLARDSSGNQYVHVNDVLSKTSTRVFAFRRNMPNMDPATLTGLSAHYSIDKAHVYFDTIASVITSPNLKNVRVWDQANSWYVTDGINVYWRDTVLTKCDGNTFGMFPQSDVCYDGNGVYVKGSGRSVYKIPFNYDPLIRPKSAVFSKKFRYIMYNRQAYDFYKDTVYANLTNAEIVALGNGKYFSGNSRDTLQDIGRFINNGGKLYFEGKELKGVDGNSFVEFSGVFYKDKKHVFTIDKQRIVTKVVKGVDVSTFHSLWYWYFVDKHYLYFGHQRLIKSDDIQILTAFYRLGKTDIVLPSPSYCLFKNIKGFWLIHSDYLYLPAKVWYLGEKFDPKWNKAFENFELPKGL